MALREDRLDPGKAGGDVALAYVHFRAEIPPRSGKGRGRPVVVIAEFHGDESGESGSIVVMDVFSDFGVRGHSIFGSLTASELASVKGWAAEHLALLGCAGIKEGEIPT